MGKQKFVLSSMHLFLTPPHLHLPVIVGSSQRVVSSKSGHVDVVLDDHDVAHFEVLVQASSCVRHDHSFDAHQLEDTHGQRNLESNVYSNVS